MSIDRIAEAARGEMDVDLLTGTGSGRFLPTEYFKGTAPSSVLEDADTLQYLAQNLKKGVIQIL